MVTARCPTHDVTLPCPGHAADHHAGEHTTRPEPDLCPRCDTTPAETDSQALAAGDDSLDSPNERNER